MQAEPLSCVMWVPSLYLHVQECQARYRWWPGAQGARDSCVGLAEMYFTLERRNWGIEILEDFMLIFCPVVQ